MDIWIALLNSCESDHSEYAKQNASEMYQNPVNHESILLTTQKFTALIYSCLYTPKMVSHYVILMHYV